MHATQPRDGVTRGRTRNRNTSSIAGPRAEGTASDALDKGETIEDASQRLRPQSNAGSRPFGPVGGQSVGLKSGVVSPEPLMRSRETSPNRAKSTSPQRDPKRMADGNEGPEQVIPTAPEEPAKIGKMTTLLHKLNNPAFRLFKRWFPNWGSSAVEIVAGVATVGALLAFGAICFSNPATGAVASCVLLGIALWVGAAGVSYLLGKKFTDANARLNKEKQNAAEAGMETNVQAGPKKTLGGAPPQIGQTNGASSAEDSKEEREADEKRAAEKEREALNDGRVDGFVKISGETQKLDHKSK